MTRGELWIEKRRSERLDLSFPVIYHLLRDTSRGAADKKGRGESIGRGGIRLVTREKIRPRSLLCIKIILPDDLPQVTGKAQVVWSKEKPGEKDGSVEYHLGLRFVELESAGGDLVSRFMTNNIKKMSGL